MRILLIADYRGVLTGETYYKAGEYETGAAMPLSHAQALVVGNRADLIEADPEPVREPVRVTKRRTSK